jgi:hypothetical protein
MLRFSRRPGRHHAATAASSFRSPLTAPRAIPARPMARTGLTLAVALLPAWGMTTLVACGGDDDDGVADAGRDAGPLAVCKPSDCTAPMPTMQVCTVGTAIFTCARNIDLRCAWLNPRCTTGNADANVPVTDGPDAGAASDTGSEDAVSDDAADASD